MATDIESQVAEFYARIDADPRHRLRSWEHSFRVFADCRAHDSEDKRDLTCLHLAFYLASWGMYRGSSFLIWKDYQIHRPVVDLLLNHRYSHLHSLTPEAVTDGPLDQIVSLARELKETYRKTVTEVNGKRKRVTPSDTLVTKILLGTLGCAAACDRFLIIGLRHSNLSFSRFGKSHLKTLIRFYKEHAHQFEQSRRILTAKTRVQYPMMKLLDMYFWNLGYSLDPVPNVDEPRVEG